MGVVMACLEEPADCISASGTGHLRSNGQRAGPGSWHLRPGPHSPSAQPCSCRITPLQASRAPSASGPLLPHFLAGVPGSFPHTPSSPQVTSCPSMHDSVTGPLAKSKLGFSPCSPSPPSAPSSSLTCLPHHPTPASQAPQAPDG